MRFHPAAVLTAALLVAPGAHAQQTATLDDVVVVGASDLLANFLKVSLSVQPGTALSAINPRAVELETTGTGFFKSASAELVTQNGRDVLRITVVPNPTISTVEVQGVNFVPAEQVRRVLEERLNIAAGATLNTVRIDESKEFLRQAYREGGFPFEPGVSAEVKETAQGATVTYVVDENAPVSRIEVTGTTQIGADVVQNAFKPLVDNKTFTVALYQQAIQAIGNAYAEKGLQGSGIDVNASALENGTFKVVVRELAVGRIDTSLLGNVNATLQTKTGDLLRQDLVAQDVRTLTNATGRPVSAQYQPDPANPTIYNVVFSPSATTTGPVREVRVEGNTVVSAEDIAKVLGVRIGDTYNPEIAQRDVLAVRRLYNSRGYEISTREPIAYRDGVLTYTIREVKLAGYDIQFQGARSTQDRVILRELPEPGGVLNSNELLRRVQNNVARLGFVAPVSFQFRTDPQNPELVTYVLILKEQNQNIFSPAVAFDTLNGFSGELSYSSNNLFGLGQSVSVSASAGQNDAGEIFSGNASYTIPWLDIDFLDFRRTRTSLSFNLYSSVSGNNPITRADPANPSTTQRTGREFTERTSGFSVNAGRQVAPNLTAGGGVSLQYNYDRLEPVKSGETVVDGFDEAAALALVPKAGFTTLLTGNLNYDSVNYADFPTGGLRGNASAGYGFGYEGSNALGWTQLEAGGRAYFGFGQTLENGNQQQAIAFRVNAGSIIGEAPTSRLFRVGGASSNEALTLRGYDSNAFIGKTFVTSSAEYRYNFNLNASIAQGLYGIAFVDAGTAFNDGSSFGLNVGYGLGVQLNLGLGAFGFPLRFDYGFSPQNPGGKFTFRLGVLF